MDYINEAVALGLDVLILGFCIKEYSTYKQTCQSLKVKQMLIIFFVINCDKCCFI